MPSQPDQIKPEENIFHLSKGIKIFAGIAVFVAFFILFNDDYIEELVLLIIALIFFKIDYIIKQYKILEKYQGFLGMIIASLFILFISASIAAVFYGFDIINRSIFGFNIEVYPPFKHFIYELILKLGGYSALYNIPRDPTTIIHYPYIMLIIGVGITISGYMGYLIGSKRKIHFLTYPSIFWILLVLLLSVISRLI